MFLKLFAMLLMLDVATFCEKFLIDAEYLINELGRIRQLALAVPLTRDSYGPTNSVVDAVWNLEERIRYLRGLEESKKTNVQLRRRKRNGNDTPEDDSTAVSEPRRDQWKRDRHQQELFDTEELSGLRSAELSRELREIQNATNQPSRKEKRRTPAVNEDRLGAALSRAGELSRIRTRET